MDWGSGRIACQHLVIRESYNLTLSPGQYIIQFEENGAITLPQTAEVVIVRETNIEWDAAGKFTDAGRVDKILNENGCARVAEPIIFFVRSGDGRENVFPYGQLYFVPFIEIGEMMNVSE